MTLTDEQRLYAWTIRSCAACFEDFIPQHSNSIRCPACIASYRTPSRALHIRPVGGPRSPRSDAPPIPQALPIAHGPHQAFSHRYPRPHQL